MNSYIIKYAVIILLIISCRKPAAEEIRKNKPENNIFETKEVAAPGSKENKKPADIVCLIYHRFGDSRYPSTNTSVRLFQNQLQYLKEHEFKIIMMSEAINLIQNNKEVGKTAVITVDDGFKSFIKNAEPILKQYGFKATIFINTETVGALDYMGWNELKLLLQNGFEIGNHSHSHAYFLNDKKHKISDFKNDINLSKTILLEQLGIDPKIFSFPYGEYDEDLINAIRELGFHAAAGQYAGVFCELSDIYTIPRFPMNDQFGAMNTFIEKVNMKALRVRINPANTQVNKINPPILNITFDNNNYETNQIQGFTQGGKPILKIAGDSILSVSLTSDRKLTKRRTIYTITIPSKDNHQWYWYSHLWVNTDLSEE